MLRSTVDQQQREVASPAIGDRYVAVVPWRNGSTRCVSGSRSRNVDATQSQDVIYATSVIALSSIRLERGVELSLILGSNAPEAGRSREVDSAGVEEGGRKGRDGYVRKNTKHHGEDAPRTPAPRATRNTLFSALTALTQSSTFVNDRKVTEKRQTSS